MLLSRLRLQVSMVHKPLPQALVRKLEGLSSELEGSLKTLPVADRRNRYLHHDPNQTDTFGVRTRFYRHPEFPNVPVVLKRADLNDEIKTAGAVIEAVQAWVDEHNQPNAPFVLVKPQAVALSDRLIAMRRTHAPTLAEIIEPERRTAAGVRFLNKYPGAQEKLKAAFDALKDREFHSRLRWPRGDWGDLWVMGWKGGKPIFMPHVDV